MTPGSTLAQVTLALIYIAPLLLTQALTWKEKVGPAVWFAVVYVLVQLVKQYRELEPHAWDEAREHYIDRKHEFARVIRRLATCDSDQMRHDFQRDCLWLVANYVRAWRWDLGEKQIFASLLIEDPKDPNRLVLVARDREDRSDARQVPKTYRKSERLISECFETGKYCVISNLALQYSDSVGPDCAYKSILGLPLKDRNGKVLAVVSIDSVLAYHFDDESDELEVKLQPYLAALLASVERYRGTR